MKKILITASLIMLVMMSVFTLFNHKPNYDELFEVYYELGEVIDVPPVELSYQGEKKLVGPTITKPNGDLITTQTLHLDVVGMYEIEYRTDIKGQQVEQVNAFEVRQKLYEVNRQNASAYYGAHPYTPTVDGIIVSLNAGATFIYNDVLDLSGLTKDMPVLELYLTPEVLGERDFEQINVRFTDVYDASNYLDIAVNSSPEGIGHPVSYMRAGAFNQPLTGFEYAWNRLHRYNRYGYAFDMSFYGRPRDGGSLENDGLVLAFDYDELQLHGKQSTATETLVIDFDNRDHFDELWHGFTTGEVKLEITGDYLRKSNANFVITNILGQDLSRTYVEDNQGPTININYEQYSASALPKGLVDHPYPIFNALSRDAFSGVVETIVEVYFDNDGVMEPVSVDQNTFTPTKQGNYQILYKAYDDSNNLSKLFVDIEVLSAFDEPEIMIGEDRKTVGFVGEIIPLAHYTTSGGIGILQSTVEVYLDDEAIVLNDDRFLMPTKEGTYRIIYKTIDYVLREYTVSYEVDVEFGTDPFIYEDASLPWYFIDGKEYELPTLEATYYNAQGSYKNPTKIYVTDMLGKIELGNPYYVPRVSSHKDTVMISYEAGNTIKTYEVPVFKAVNGSNYDLKRYFDTTNDLMVRSNQNSVNIQTSVSNSEATFINRLPIEDVRIRFSIDALDNFMGGVDIILIDAHNPDIQLTVQLTGSRVDENLTRISIDGIRTYALNGGFNGDQFTVEYDHMENAIYADNRNVFIKLWDFEGFDSDEVYIKFVFKDVIAKSIFHIHNISGQNFSSVQRDLITPLIIIENEFSGQNKIDNIHYLPAAKAMDILDPELTFHVTVRNPDGEIIRDENGLLLNEVNPYQAYAFKLEQYGTYRATYYASDRSDNHIQRHVFINVLDDQKPVITYENLMPKTAKIGDLVVASNAKAMDNVDGEVAVFIYLTTPSGNMISLPGNAFYATEVGTYTLRYMAMDKAGNAIIETFDVTVTK